MADPTDIEFLRTLDPAPLGFRQRVRQTVEALPTAARVAVETLPPTLAGILFPAFGGVAAEAGLQALGVTPEDPMQLGLAALPFGKVAAPAFRAAKAITKRLPFVRPHLAQRMTQDVLTERDQLLTRLTPAPPASDLFAQLSKAGVRLTPKALPKTQNALNAVQAHVMKDIDLFPEAKQLLGRIQQARQEIQDRTVTLDLVKDLRSSFGLLVSKYEAASGRRFGGAKQITGAIIQDMEALTTSPSKTVRQGAVLAKQAIETAKREFALRDLADQLTEVRHLPGQGAHIQFNAAKALTWLDNVTNPRSVDFDKNFVTGIGADLPGIKDFLIRANQIPQLTSGAGSLVVQSLGATIGAGTGAAAGGAVAGVPGAAVGGGLGAIAGTQLPDLLADLLSSKAGQVALDRLLVQGQGRLTERGLQGAAQLVRAGATRPLTEPRPDISEGPVSRPFAAPSPLDVLRDVGLF